MASSKDYVIIDISAGEVVLVDWFDEMAKKSADAIAGRVAHIDPTMTAHGRSVEVSERKVQLTRGRKAKAPKGHRVAYTVKLKAFGREDGQLVKLLRKAYDAGKV